MATTTAAPDEAPELEAVEEVDPTLTIHQRMGRILAELPALPKAQQNKEQGFFFRGYDDTLVALNPLLAKYGVFVLPDVVERVTRERTTSRGSTMYETNLHVRFRFCGPNGDSVEASGWGEGTDMGDKATNKAMTVAFKYVLFQTFAIAVAEAQDSDAETPEETTSGRRRADGPGGGSGGAPARSTFTVDDAIGGLAHYVEDGKPWVKAAVEGLFEGVKLKRWEDSLIPSQRTEALTRLRQVVEDLDGIEGLASLPPEDVADHVRLAFETRFKAGVEWPPYKPAIPF